MLKICLVDDEKSIRETFQWYFEGHGHEVVTYRCPLEMLRHCAACNSHTSSCFDVLFVDYEMPSIKGLDFLEHLNRHTCKLPPERKFLISGALNTQIMSRASDLGVTTLPKPLSLLALDQILSQFEMSKQGQPVGLGKHG